MLSNQNNSVSVCNRVTMPLTSPGVESEARAMTKRKRRLDSGMVAMKLDSWTPLGEQGTELPGLRARARRGGAPCKGALTAERALSGRGLTAQRPRELRSVRQGLVVERHGPLEIELRLVMGHHSEDRHEHPAESDARPGRHVRRGMKVLVRVD